MKILITGTHFTPAQAVIEQLKKDPKIEIVYLGRKSTREGDKSPSAESYVLPKMRVRFIPFIAGRLQRSFTFYTIPSLLKIPLGLLQALYLLVEEQPDVILSFGGYVAVPVVIAGWLLSIPIIIHEQTLIPGLANKISFLFADKIAVSFKVHDFSKSPKAVLTGNPLRQEVLLAQQNSHFSDHELAKIVNVAKQHTLPVIFISGGNQGSHIINQTILMVLDELAESACIIHQTGDSKFQDFERLIVLKKNMQYPDRYYPTKWIDAHDIGKLFNKVDLAVGRAGINTLTELAYFAKPIIVIPIPYLEEQIVNARFFERMGMAKIIDQKNLTSDRLLFFIKAILKELPKYQIKAQKAKELVIKDAASRLATETLVLAKKYD